MFVGFNATKKDSRGLTAPGGFGGAKDRSGGADIPVCPDCRIPRGRQECLPHRDKDRGLLAPGCFFSHRIASLHHVILTCCVVFATLAASAVWADPYVNAASTFVAPHPAVVRVVAPDSDGVSYGSGSLVAVDETSGLIVTNWHVVRDAVGPIVIYFPDGFRSRGVLLRVDRDWDLAALAIRRPNVQPIPLASQTPRPGDPLTIIGYGSGSYRVATGRCTEYVSPGGNNPAEMVELSAPAQRRLGRTDPQHSWRVGGRAVRHRLGMHHRQLLRPAARVPRLGRRRFSRPVEACDAGRPIAFGRAAGDSRRLGERAPNRQSCRRRPAADRGGRGTAPAVAVPFDVAHVADR